MKVYALVNTAGEAAVDAALTDLGLRVWSGPAVPFTCECGTVVRAYTYDDGLCGWCRYRNDQLLLNPDVRDEAERLVQRVTDLFPTMTSGQVFAMATNILRSQEIAVWAS